MDVLPLHQVGVVTIEVFVVWFSFIATMYTKYFLFGDIKYFTIYFYIV